MISVVLSLNIYLSILTVREVSESGFTLNSCYGMQWLMKLLFRCYFNTRKTNHDVMSVWIIFSNCSHIWLLESQHKQTQLVKDNRMYWREGYDSPCPSADGPVLTLRNAQMLQVPKSFKRICSSKRMQFLHHKLHSMDPERRIMMHIAVGYWLHVDVYIDDAVTSWIGLGL